MTMKKGKVQIQLDTRSGPMGIVFEVPKSIRDLQPAAWDRFRKQIRSWTSKYPAPEAEEGFIKTYVPEARVLPEDERCLTGGLVFAYKGNLYWDELYQISSFLEDLVATGKIALRFAGADPTGKEEAADEQA